MALPLVVMGVGMGLIVAPLTDAILSEVPREHAGSASGLINTVQQMGNALGLGLVSVVFFGTISDHLSPDQVGPAFADAFQHALRLGGRGDGRHLPADVRAAEAAGAARGGRGRRRWRRRSRRWSPETGERYGGLGASGAGPVSCFRSCPIEPEPVYFRKSRA